MSGKSLSLTVCRGCCCGTDDRQAAGARLMLLRQRLPGTSVRTSTCLGPCDRRDVIVVQRRGHAPLWLSRMDTRSRIEQLASWLEDHDRTVSSLPRHLSGLVFRPARRARRR